MHSESQVSRGPLWTTTDLDVAKIIDDDDDDDDDDDGDDDEKEEQ